MIFKNILNINQYKKITHIFFDLFGVLINYNKTKIILSPANDLLSELQDKYELWIDNKKDLKGLPQMAIDAAKETAISKNKKNKWLFTLQFPSMMPIMKFLENQN